MPASTYYWISLIAVLGVAVASDLRSRKIPNWLVAAALVAGLAVSLTPAAPAAHGPGSALTGAVAGLLVMLPLYLLSAMGAGDTKLMAAIGAFLGPWQILGAALLTFVAGGVLALAAALWLRSLPRVADNLRQIGAATLGGQAGWRGQIQTTGRLPYAVAIAAGTGLQIWLAGNSAWPFK